MAVMEEDRRLVWRAVITCVAFVAALVLLTFMLSRRTEPNVMELPGCPLDAVRYGSPAFTGNDVSCYKVTDRSSGQVWWMAYVSGEWVVLPVVAR